LQALLSGESLKHPICADQPEISQTPGGMLYASATAVAIRKSAEPQMQRASMFFLKLFGYCSCYCFAIGQG